MHILQAGLVVLYSFMLWYEVRIGLAEYAAFKLFTETSDRQRLYRRWLLRGFLVFLISAVAGLAILGRWHSLMSLPDEFRGVSQNLQALLPDVHFSPGFLAGFGISICCGAVLGGVIAAKLADGGRSMILGDVQSLMPRNWPETGHTLLLSLNAGLGEELLFRLFLPLLLTLLCGNAIFAFLLAGAVFGLMHVYQGLSASCLRCSSVSCSPASTLQRGASGSSWPFTPGSTSSGWWCGRRWFACSRQDEPMRRSKSASQYAVLYSALYPEGCSCGDFSTLCLARWRCWL